jgi:hypothetical protein
MSENRDPVVIEFPRRSVRQAPAVGHTVLEAHRAPTENELKRLDPLDKSLVHLLLAVRLLDAGRRSISEVEGDIAATIDFLRVARR